MLAVHSMYTGSTKRHRTPHLFLQILGSVDPWRTQRTCSACSPHLTHLAPPTMRRTFFGWQILGSVGDSQPQLQHLFWATIFFCKSCGLAPRDGDVQDEVGPHLTGSTIATPHTTTHRTSPIYMRGMEQSLGRGGLLFCSQAMRTIGCMRNLPSVAELKLHKLFLPPRRLPKAATDPPKSSSL